MVFLLTKSHTSLDPRIRGLWVASLREEGVVQGHPYLSWWMGKEWSTSVLGVLMRLATNEGVPIPRVYKNQIILPKEVVQWAGLTSQTGELPDGRTLLEINEEYSFLELAAIIEEYL